MFKIKVFKETHKGKHPKSKINLIYINQDKQYLFIHFNNFINLANRLVFSFLEVV